MFFQRLCYQDRRFRPYIREVSDFIDYNLECHKKLMTFKYFDEYTLSEVEEIREYQNRYSENYVKSVYARLKKLESWSRQEFRGTVTLMTLTVKQRGKTICDCLRDLADGRSKLFKVLRKIRDEIGYLEYFWVIEPHKSGYPHLHAMIFTEIDFKGQYENRLKKLWADKYQKGSFKNGLHLGSDEGGSSDSRDIEYMCQYLFKYLGKTLMMSLDLPTLVFQACVWSMRKPEKNRRIVERRNDGSGLHNTYPAGTGSYRLWGCSRKLSEVMKYSPENKEVRNCVQVRISREDEVSREDEEFVCNEKCSYDLYQKIVVRQKKRDFIQLKFEG